MKNNFLKILSIAGLMLFMAACQTGADDPKAVAKKFFEALKTMNIDEAAKYATKESKTMLDMMKMSMNMAPQNLDSLKSEMDKQTIEYSEPVINGDEATLTVTVNNKEKTNFSLKKEEGKWKVAFDKNTLMKSTMDKMEERGASEEDLKAAQEAFEKMKEDAFKEDMQDSGSSNAPKQ